VESNEGLLNFARVVKVAKGSKSGTRANILTAGTVLANKPEQILAQERYGHGWP